MRTGSESSCEFEFPGRKSGRLVTVQMLTFTYHVYFIIRFGRIAQVDFVIVFFLVLDIFEVVFSLSIGRGIVSRTRNKKKQTKLTRT